MLKKSKSIYFIKRLFTFVDEKDKLDIIKYNKNMQNILDISLINYKFFSDRYIIFEKNGKGKEYNNYNDSLVFEGKYLNKKRNGKGKEYDWKGKLIFEGEYLNGKRWNGNGYDPDNNIAYKLKDGKGKEYDKYGKLIFEGEYLNRKRNGKGIEYYDKEELNFEERYLLEKTWNLMKYNNKFKFKFEGEF